MRVKVYKNLQRNCWSVVGPEGKVIDHVDHIVLYDPEFRVQPAGNRKVRQNKVKNVHAYVTGVQAKVDGQEAPKEHFPFTYNPYAHDTFVYEDPMLSGNWKPLHKGERCLLLTDEFGDLTLVANPS